MVIEWLWTGFDIMKSIARTLGVKGISCAAKPCHTVLPTCKKDRFFSDGWNNSTYHASSWSMQRSLGVWKQDTPKSIGESQFAIYIYIIYIYKHKHNHKWVVYPICRSIPTILLAQIMLIVIYLCHYPRYLTVVSHHITITYGSHEIPSKYHEYPMKFPLKNSFLSINHGPNRGTAHGRPAPSWKRSWLKIHGAYQVF